MHSFEKSLTSFAFSHFMTDRISMNSEDLDRIERQVLSGESTLSECCLCAHVLYHDEWQYRDIDRRTLKACFLQENRIPPKRGPGRKMRVNNEEILAVVLQLREQMVVGITKMYYKINQLSTRKQYNIQAKVTHTQIRTIYIAQGWTKMRKKIPTIYRCHCEATQPNALWRTDLHDCTHFDLKMMIIIDDCSRKILNWALLPSKKSELTATVLYQAIVSYGPVWALLSDNGLEFEGMFKQVIVANDIVRLHTKPNNPQQNGKVERIWPSFERTCHEILKVQDWVTAYNAMPHLALPKNEIGNYQSPNDVYASKRHWKPGTQGKWIVDEFEKPILPFPSEEMIPLSAKRLGAKK
jgi:transposase InsO family protein